MKRSLLLAAAALAAVTLVAAGCGGSDEVPADAVAVVDGTSITGRRSTSSWPARRSPTRRRSAPSRRPARPSTSPSRRRRSPTSCSAQEYAREAEKLGIDVTDGQIAKKLEEVKKQYFCGEPGEVREGARGSGVHGGHAARRHSLAARHGGHLQEGHERREGHGRGPQDLLRPEQVEVLGARVACRATHSRQDKGRGRRDPFPAPERRGFHGDRQGEVPRPGLEGPGRQAHGDAGPDRRAVRQGGVRAEDGRALAAGQDRVRLPPHPAARRRQGGLRDAVLAGEEPDSLPARIGAEEQRRERLGRRTSRRSTRTRSSTPPGSSRRTPRRRTETTTASG